MSPTSVVPCSVNLRDRKHESERVLGIADLEDVDVAEVVAVNLIGNRPVTLDGQ